MTKEQMTREQWFKDVEEAMIGIEKILDETETWTWRPLAMVRADENLRRDVSELRRSIENE